MKKTFFGKRVPAGILAMLILLGALPVIALPSFAANDSTLGEYVALPITIRDYAADGMLFEYNEENVDGGFKTAPNLTITEMAELGSDDITKTKKEDDELTYIQYKTNSTNTNNIWASYITYDLRSYSYQRSELRYCVISYRTSSAAASNLTPDIGHRWGDSGSDYKTFTKSGYSKSNFTKVMIDLGSGSNVVTFITLKHGLPAGATIDIEYLKFFSNKDLATKYLNGDVDYTGGNNMQFGFLMSNKNTHDYSGQGVDKHMNSSMPGTQMINVNAIKTPKGQAVTLANGAKETVLAGRTRVGLVNTTLGDDKQLVYNKETVDYFAWLLQQTLSVTEKNSSGKYNYNYVTGSNVYDDNGTPKNIATVLREKINANNNQLGNYADAQNKYNSGKLTEVAQCSTYYEAAYFLLHNTFTDSKGYGQTNSQYNTLRLVKNTDPNNKTYYCFNSAYNDTDYNASSGYIANTGFVYNQIFHNGWSGISIPLLRFNPINNTGYGNNGSIYRDISETVKHEQGSELYKETNYNLTLEGHAQFIFYEDDDMYFTFTGDDDVYLFINNKMVMDLGAAHSISKVTINLNDVKELCGLHDGEAYDFDFFYMERHGTAANFGIETNIRIVDPSMVTEKSAYQNGSEVGNGGNIDAKKPVKYQYELTNNGEAKIVDLEFDDTQIGVKLTKDSITLNSETEIGELYAAVYDKDGKKKADHPIGTLTEATLKKLLADGLEVGDRISLFGFEYTIPDKSWVSDQFTNTVYTKAVTDGSNTRYRTLTGIDTSTVKKSNVVYEPLHYYEWAGKGVTATNTELIDHVNKALTAAKKETVAADAKINLCSASGKADTDSYKYNKNASIVDGGVKYVAAEISGSDKHQTGASTYYYMIGECGPVSVTVYSYDVADDKFVIDYNLPVTFDGNETFLKNDTLTLGVNPYATTATPTVADPIGTYGTVDVSGMSITYTMNKFMNGVEAVTLNVTILENGAETVTTKTGVEMTETIYIAPANVVYYEDDFEGITYINSDGNTWEYFETSDRGTSQSADQNTPYGSDPNYAGDKATVGYESKLVDAIKEFVSSISVFNFGDLLANDTAPTAERAGSGNAAGSNPVGDSSNGTIHRLCVGKTAEVMSFKFKGTGFEILSRTTQDIYAVVSVKVVSKTTGQTVKQFPVITECKGGDLYQVPILAVKGLPLDEYTVTLSAAGGTSTKSRTLYIDGVRIYQPLDENDQTKYYNASEANAEFYEIKNLIGEGRAWYAEVDQNSGTMVSGSTLIENVESDGLTLTSITDVNKYLDDGPNNELYLDGTKANSFLALKLKRVEGAEQIMLHIGAHRKAAASEFVVEGDSQSTYLIAGKTAHEVINGKHMVYVSSGTEQYIDLALTDADFDDNGYCTLFIGTKDEGEGYQALVLTNIKYKGVTIEKTVDDTTTAEQLSVEPLMVEARALAAYYSDPYDPELSIKHTDVLALRGIFSKKATVTLTVRTTEPLQKIVVTDAAGQVVEVRQYTIGFPGYATTVSAVWQVEAKRGEVLNYTVRAYNADGLSSVNTVEVSAKVK